MDGSEFTGNVPKNAFFIHPTRDFHLENAQEKGRELEKMMKELNNIRSFNAANKKGNTRISNLNNNTKKLVRSFLSPNEKTLREKLGLAPRNLPEHLAAMNI